MNKRDRLLIVLTNEVRKMGARRSVRSIPSVRKSKVKGRIINPRSKVSGTKSRYKTKYKGKKWLISNLKA